MSHSPSSELSSPLQSLGLPMPLPSFSTGVGWHHGSGPKAQILSPIDGASLGELQWAGGAEAERVLQKSQAAFLEWRKWSAPQRGEVVRQIGQALREDKNTLGRLITLETGKSLHEGLGEVQEMIDICDFAVGLSRRIYGLTIPSERTDHKILEQWHPLGSVLVISAFNFPTAVWSWNAMLAAVCGNTIIWKPSEKTPLTALATHQILQRTLKDLAVPEGVFNLILGTGAEVGEKLVRDPRIALVSATGSTRMGLKVNQIVSERFGKVLLELGGNNAIIVTAKADLKKAIPAIVFGSVGTAGQRCTTTRRLILHPQIYDVVKNELVKVYKTLRIGSPLDRENLMGPLIDSSAVRQMQEALTAVKAEGGKLLCGGDILQGSAYASGCYVTPALVEAEPGFETVRSETFAPILYLLRYSGDLEDAIAIQNSTDYGLSSAIFTEDLNESEVFLSHRGSDCGIANINTGTSGAEIGGAFGGEKHTGGGRESGTDAWRAYMRRQTSTVSFAKEAQLAQGIRFDIEER